MLRSISVADTGGATTPGRPVPVPYMPRPPVAVAAPRPQFVRLDEGFSGVNGVSGVSGINGVNVSGVSSNAGAAGDVQKVREELEAQMGWVGRK